MRIEISLCPTAPPTAWADIRGRPSFAYVAANEALAMSGLVPDDRCGIVMGTALAGLTCIGQTQEAASLAHKPVGPRFMTKIMRLTR